MKCYAIEISRLIFKSEKHAPVIEAPASVKADEAVTVSASVGKEIAHPNATEHHIVWIELYFKPDSEKFAHQLSVNRFTAHGESAQGRERGFCLHGAGMPDDREAQGVGYALRDELLQHPRALGSPEARRSKSSRTYAASAGPRTWP